MSESKGIDLYAPASSKRFVACAVRTITRTDDATSGYWITRTLTSPPHYHLHVTPQPFRARSARYASYRGVKHD